MKNNQKRKSEKRKRQREKKKQKLADERTRRIFKYTIVIILSIVCPFSYCKQQKAMEVSDITIGKIVDIYRPLTRPRGPRAIIEYYVSGKRYDTSGRPLHSKYPGDVGDCFLIKYSISNPNICEVLWEEGKQDCDCFK